MDCGINITFIPRKGTKTADWWISYDKSKDKVFVELTEMSSLSPREKVINRTQKKIGDNLLKYSVKKNNLIFAGKLLKDYISDPSLKEIFRTIRSIAKLAETDGFASIDTDKLCLGFATKTSGEILKRWSLEKGIITNPREIGGVSKFGGPGFEIDETYRILDRIDRKKSQLEKSSLNIIIIKNNRVFHSHNVIEYYMDKLEEFVYSNEYLALLIICGGFVASKGVVSSLKLLT